MMKAQSMCIESVSQATFATSLPENKVAVQSTRYKRFVLDYLLLKGKMNISMFNDDLNKTIPESCTGHGCIE